MRKSGEQTNLQLALNVFAPEGGNLPEVFRRLYYQLYTNSEASRAERIVENISLLLLLKLFAEQHPDSTELATYLASSDCQANDVLLPVLRRVYPDFVDLQDRFTVGDRAVRFILRELVSVSLSAAPAHVLGEAFQALIGPGLRGDKGQFFTPRSLVRAIVNVIAPQPHESVLDPACGTGGFLAEAHAFQVAHGAPRTPLGSIVGIDKDHDLARLGGALLQIASRGRAHVFHFNSLDPQQWELRALASQQYDVILTNPPFGTRIGVRDPAILKEFSLGAQWVQTPTGAWTQTPQLCAAQDPQLLFLELCIRKLKGGGRLAIVLPEGVFGNKKQGYVWAWVRSQGRIFALLDCPRTTFQPGTDTKTNVLFFEKATRGARTNTTPAWVAVALHCGHDRRGRQEVNGAAYQDDFAVLGTTFSRRTSRHSGWRKVNLTNDYLVPRYYVKETPADEQELQLTKDAPVAALGELVREGVLSIRRGHEVGSEAYGTGDIPFVRTSDLSNCEISTDPTKSVDEEIYRTFAPQQQLAAGDVLIVADGRYRIGTSALLSERTYRCVVQSHLRILKLLSPTDLDPYELLFALNLPSVRLRLRDLVFVQSTLGTLGKRLLELRIPILHGTGPWKDRIERFREVIRERDRLLREVKTMAAPEIEL